jgi:hypothetical protein
MVPRRAIVGMGRMAMRNGRKKAQKEQKRRGIGMFRFFEPFVIFLRLDAVSVGGGVLSSMARNDE